MMIIFFTFYYDIRFHLSMALTFFWFLLKNSKKKEYISVNLSQLFDRKTYFINKLL